MAHVWTPVRVEVFDQEGTLRDGDFPSWGGVDPVFSERGANALRNILEENGELLPLKGDSGSYHVFNVTRVADILDESRSTLERFPSGRVMLIRRYEFVPSIIPSDLAIFKIPQQLKSRVYVTDFFVREVNKAALKGFKFRKLWPG